MENDDELGAYVDAISALVGLKIDPAYRPAVIENLRRAQAIAGVALSAPLADDLESAPVFRP